ncbi:MAG: transglycosylase SLT domain-containing protein [Myxococcota bacterium]
MCGALTVLISVIALGGAPDVPDPAEHLEDVREWVRAGRIGAATTALSAMLPLMDDEAARRDARYLLGRILVDRGRAEGARYLEALPAPWEPVDDRRLLWLARGRALQAEDEAALEALDDALAAGLPDSEEADLRLLRAEVLDALERPEEAAGTLRRVADGDGPRHLRARALRRLALRLADSDPEAATRHARRLLRYHPGTEAAQAGGMPVSVEDLSDRERFRRARRLMRVFRYEEARRELRRLLDHPRLGREAAWRVGDIGLHRLRDAPGEARAMFRRVLEEGGSHREDALFGLMRTFVKEDRYEEALEVGARYRKRYPRGKFRETVDYYEGWLPYDERRCDEALPHLKRYIRVHGRRKSYVRGFVAWCHLRNERWEQAIEAFEHLVPYGGQLMRGKAWYWQAVAFDRLDRRDEARDKLARLRKHYPLTWYDVLGQQLLARWDGRDPRASKLPWPEGGGEALAAHPLDPAAWDWPGLSGRTASRFRRVRRLVEIGEVDRARAEYRSIRSRVERAVPRAQRLEFIRFVSHAVEDFKHAWRVVSDGRLGAMMKLEDRGGVRWLLAYPRAYRHLVERLGEEHGVPPTFVWAIMRQESRYHPAMVSAADAIGALQMIPQTAEKVAADMGTTYEAPTFPDPRVGFPFSFFYMANHDATWNGQLVLTAASYNAGPEPVARWLRENPGASLAVLAEEISYNEARAYARMVAGHMLRNLYLYVPDAADRAPLLDRLFPVEVDYDVPEDVGY